MGYGSAEQSRDPILRNPIKRVSEDIEDMEGISSIPPPSHVPIPHTMVLNGMLTACDLMTWMEMRTVS